MSTTKASELVRRVFSAYEQNDRAQVEAVLAEDITFSSPPDELEKADGSRGRNTEYFVVDGDKITRCEVYFGPSL